MKHHTRQPGFVILFSIVISAIVLLISAGVYKIASQEVILSGISRESLRAFYAADSGIECALGEGVHTQVQIPQSVSCAGSTHTLNGITGMFSVNFEDNTCAQVTVTEELNDLGQLTRELFSRGFNTPCDNNGQPDFQYKSLVERTLHVRFLSGTDTGIPSPDDGGSLSGTGNPSGIPGPTGVLSGTSVDFGATPAKTPSSSSSLNALLNAQAGN